MRRRFALLLASLPFALSSLLAGCDCAGPEPGRSCRSPSDCRSGELCVDMMCVARPDGGPEQDADIDGARPDTGPPPCITDADCGGGVCLPDGTCCGDPADVCGSACCGGTGEVCFASACVVPGATCRSAEDCAEGEYCEPGLAEGAGMDGGMPPGRDGGTSACLGAAPAPGRCVALPPTCSADPPPPGEICITTCEYRPPVGMLNAVEEWRWGPTAAQFPNSTDVWATPTVGRVTDTNCDGAVDEFDPPTVIFVSGNAMGTCCSCGGFDDSCKTGVLRAVDGRSGEEIWSLRRAAAGSMGFAGLSVAIGDLDHDGDMEIVTVTGEGNIAIIDHTGATVTVSSQGIPGWAAERVTGWGGGLSIADADHDGNPEISYGRVAFTTDGATVTRLWAGTGDWGRAITQAISVWVNLDADPELELLAGRTAYDIDGSILWNRTDIPAGFSAVGNFDDDPEPEVAHVAAGRLYLLRAADGADELTSAPAMGMTPGSGGPPTIADFDGDGRPEIGVAWREFYQAYDADYEMGALTTLWATPNHDLSSSVTGSTVFDFEGDGAAEVIYNDECFLWVYDGRTGAVRFATQTTSFTATEASLVADVDGDGSAEILIIANGASPVSWNCTQPQWLRPALETEPDFGRPAWVGSDGAIEAYRGIAVFGSFDGSWVGTRTLWNQHAYSVTNICGDRGDPCVPPGAYGDIPMTQVDNWGVGFLNNFRQNVQGEGLFDAPDAVVSLEAICRDPIVLRASVRNIGARNLPPGVEVAFYSLDAGGAETEIGRGTTGAALFPGQVGIVEFAAPAGTSTTTTFRARIVLDPTMPIFRECRDDNNTSDDAMPRCLE